MESKTLEGLGGWLEEGIGCCSTGVEAICSVVETSGVLVITIFDVVAGTLGSVCEVSAGGDDGELNTEDDVSSGEITISDVGTGVGTGVGSLTGPVLDRVSKMLEGGISIADELVEDAI